MLLADDNVLLLGSLAAPRYGHTVPFADAVKERDGIRTLHLKPSTREAVRSEAEGALRDLLSSTVQQQQQQPSPTGDVQVDTACMSDASDDGVEGGSAADDASSRKARKKLAKAERREKRAGRAPPGSGSKPCDVCGRPVEMLIRCRIDETRAWKMVCGRCWKDVSGGVTDGDADHPWCGLTVQPCVSRLLPLLSHSSKTRLLPITVTVRVRDCPELLTPCVACRYQYGGLWKRRR